MRRERAVHRDAASRGRSGARGTRTRASASRANVSRANALSRRRAEGPGTSEGALGNDRANERTKTSGTTRARTRRAHARDANERER